MTFRTLARFNERARQPLFYMARILVKKLTIGLDEDTLLLVSIAGDGVVTIVDKPAQGRRKRGQQQRTLVVDIKDLWNQRGDAPKVESVFDELLRRMPVADFTEVPEKVGYKVKVWLRNELKKMTEVAE